MSRKMSRKNLSGSSLTHRNIGSFLEANQTKTLENKFIFMCYYKPCTMNIESNVK